MENLNININRSLLTKLDALDGKQDNIITKEGIESGLEKGEIYGATLSSLGNDTYGKIMDLRSGESDGIMLLEVDAHPPIKPEDINYKDLKQCSYGDCYFIAALGHLAKHNPEQVAKMIDPQEDGSYNVTFGNGDTVNVEHPRSLASSRGGDWAPIIERAYAEYINNQLEVPFDNPFDAIDSGDTLENAIEVLTGHPTETSYVNTFMPWNDPNPEDIEKILIDTAKNGKMITAQVTLDSSDIFWGKTAPHEMGLEKKHAYTVLDYNEDTKTVTMRDPRGRDATGYADASNDGEFEVPFEDFMKYFYYISYEQ